MKRQVSYSHLLLILIILLFIASCVLLVVTNYFHHHHAMSLQAAATSMNNNYNNNDNDNNKKSPLKKNKMKNKNIINTPRKHGLMKNTRIDAGDEKYLPPQVYAGPVTISEHDQHHHKGLKNINKERVVLFDTDSYYYSSSPSKSILNRSNNVFTPSFVVHNHNNNNAENEMQGKKRRRRNSIRFFVIGDWGGPGRKPQRRVASLMARVAQVEDWRGAFRISNTGNDDKRPMKENDDDGKKDDDDDDNTKQEENNNNNNDRQLLLDMMMNHDEDGGDHEEEQDDEVNNNIHHHHHHHNRKEENENENHEEEKERKKISNFLSSFPPLYARPGSKHLDFIIGAGDNIYESGASNEFDHRFKRNFENVYTDPAISKKVWFNIAGNHDVFSHGIARDISGQIRYMLQSPSKRWWMPSTYYAHEFSASSLSSSSPSVTDPSPPPLLFIAFLHTYDISGAMTQMSTTQIKWLESRLRRTRAKFRIVVGHRPIFSAGKKHGSSKYMQKLLVPLFDKYNVSAYFSGDDHQIQILKSAAGMTRYVVSGAGARLEPLIKKQGGVPETLYQRKQFGFVSVEVDDEAGIRLVVHHVDENDDDEQNRKKKKNYGVSFVHEI